MPDALNVSRCTAAYLGLVSVLDDNVGAMIGALGDLTAELHRIADPEEVDRRARRDQAAPVERFGGPAAAAGIGTPAHTPAPEVGGEGVRA